MAEPQVELAHPPLTELGPRYLNRELSHINFDERVLALAEARDLPLLERVRFLAILSQNLDEFYQVLVAGLKEQLAAKLAGPGPMPGRRWTAGACASG